MKKLFFALLFATTVITSAFATDANKINFRIMHSFQSEFHNASNVSWVLRKDFAKATFVENGKKMEAFYKLSGEQIGTSKEIKIEDLPTSAKRAFAKKYSGYDVKEAIAFTGREEDAYFISAENDQESVILKVDSTESLYIYKKEKKN